MNGSHARSPALAASPLPSACPSSSRRGHRLRRLASAFAAATAAAFASGWTAPVAAQQEGSPEADLRRTIERGQTLSDLARRELDSVERWRDVAAYNGIDNPRRIRAGTVVRIKPEWLPSQRVQATVETIGGSVRIDGAVPSPGTTIGEGAEVRTTADSTVTVSLPDGTQLRIAPDTRVRIERLRSYHSDQAIEARFRLDQGGIAPKSPPNRARPLEIRSPGGNAAVRGTDFRVRAEPGAGVIEVLDGAVAAASQGGDSLLPAAQGAVVSPVRKPIVEKLLPAPYLAARWPLPQRMVGFELDLPPIPGAVAYQVEVGRDPQFVALLLSERRPQPKVSITTDRDGPLWLRMRGVSAAGIEGFDATTRLVVAARPVPPTLATAIEPPDPIVGPVVLRWTDDRPGLRYRVQVAADPGFDERIAEVVVDGRQATIELPETRRPAVRYWRVAAIEPRDHPEGPFGPARTFIQRAPATVERSRPSPTWRDGSGEPIQGGAGGQVRPGY